ncbi:hypothetical protein GCM10027073_31990 [Streptomyces chlorus]|uniref:hypothetical protein n=1 Tax=Streptomyces chlorus TaxID=887452 RepID=UPI0036D21723
MLSGWLAGRRCGSRQGPSQLVAARGFVRRHFGQRHISPAETAAVTIAPFCSVSAAAKGSAQRTDLSTIVLDQRPERDPVGSKTIAQQRDILDIWDTLDGAGRQIAQEGLTWSRARTFYREHELFYTEYTDDGSVFPPFVNLSQTRTEQVLDERIAGQQLVVTRCIRSCSTWAVPCPCTAARTLPRAPPRRWASSPTRCG